MTQLNALIEKAADYCAYCPKMCRFACPVADAEARETVTPWGLMSLLRAVGREQVPLTAETGEAFFHCTGCGRCQTYCVHKNDVAEAMVSARRLLVDGGVPLPEPLRGMDLTQERYGSPHGKVPAMPSEADEVFEDGAKVAYKPSCTARTEEPQRVVMVGRLMARILGSPLALARVQSDAGQPQGHCCGQALREAGYGAVAEEIEGAMWKGFERHKEVVTDCPGVIEAWVRRTGQRDGGPKHLVEVLAQHASILKASAQGFELEGPVYWSDVGRLGRRLDIWDAPRQVLEALLGPEGFKELWLNRGEVLGSGVGAHYERIDPQGSAQASERLIEDAVRHGARTLVVSSARQAKALRDAASDDLEVLDLVSLVAQALGVTPRP